MLYAKQSRKEDFIMNETPIVRLFFAKMKEAFFNLTEIERAAFMAKDRANLDELGMQAISMVNCSETDEQWDYIGVEGWPSMEAIAKREIFEDEDLQISKYVKYKTHVGIQESFDDDGKPLQ
jgi:hypothetical protein